jgi:hypothetical protein
MINWLFAVFRHGNCFASGDYYGAITGGFPVTILAASEARKEHVRLEWNYCLRLFLKISPLRHEPSEGYAEHGNPSFYGSPRASRSR